MHVSGLAMLAQTPCPLHLLLEQSPWEVHEAPSALYPTLPSARAGVWLAHMGPLHSAPAGNVPSKMLSHATLPTPGTSAAQLSSTRFSPLRQAREATGSYLVLVP